jgi:hypothetical protein
VSGQSVAEDSCQYHNETLSITKDWECTGHLSDYKIIKNSSEKACSGGNLSDLRPGDILFQPQLGHRRH